MAGDFVSPNSHSISISVSAPEIAFLREVILIEENAWVQDFGAGWQLLLRDNSAIQELFSAFPLHPDSLVAYEFSQYTLLVLSEHDYMNGRETFRSEISGEAAESLAGWFCDEPTDADTSDVEATLWIDRVTNTLARMELSAILPGACAVDILEAELPRNITLFHFSITLEISQQNDPDLQIDPPNVDTELPFIEPA